MHTATWREKELVPARARSGRGVVADRRRGRGEERSQGTAANPVGRMANERPLARRLIFYSCSWGLITPWTMTEFTRVM